MTSEEEGKGVDELKELYKNSMDTKKKLMSRNTSLKGTRIFRDNDRTWMERRSRHKVPIELK